MRVFLRVSVSAFVNSLFSKLSSEGVSHNTSGMFRMAPGGQIALGRPSSKAVAFFTHVFDEAIELRYRKLKSNLDGLAQIFILAQRGTPIPREFSGETYFFDYGGLRSEAARVIGDELIPGNTHLVALDFARHHPGFDYYWFVEYDVVFSGNWATLFMAVQDDRSDLLATHIRSVTEEPRWPWWSTLDLPGCPLPRPSWRRAFFPVYRISREGLGAVNERVKSGWSGHFEALVPCAIQTASLSISDLGGAGILTPEDRRHRFYSSFSSRAGESLNAGTLRHRPPHYFPRLRKNTIFHPVKSDSGNRQDGLVRALRQQHLRELPVRCAVSLYYNLLSLLARLAQELK